MFGDTNVVSIRLNKDGGFEFVSEIEGDSVEDVLTYVEYDAKEMRRNFRQSAEEAVRDGLISPADRRDIVSSYENGLRGYTYYER